MPAPVYRAWKNYEKARKPGALNYSTFKARYIEGSKYAQGTRPRIQSIGETKRLKENQQFYIHWGGPQPDLTMPDDRSGFDSSAPITSGRYEGESLKYHGNPEYESQMRRTRTYGN